MFSSVFVYSIKRTLRQKTVLFWSLIFPLLLSTLFYMAFSNLGSAELIRDPIKLAYVAPAHNNPLFSLHAILGDMPMMDESGRSLFEISTVDEAQARQLVGEDKVSAAVLDGDTPQLLLNRVGARQVVVKQVLDQVLYTKNTVAQVLRTKPLTPMNPLVSALNDANYVQPGQLGTGRMQQEVVYFYALLAMTCLGASAAGVTTLLEQQANKSRHGARVAATPANKWLRVLASGLASFLVQWALTLVVLLYMTQVLGKNFGGNPPYLLLVTGLGTLMGYMMGMALACVLRGTENVVYGAAIGLYLFSSFLTGLMSVEVKRMVDTALPFLSRVNPGSMIVDALYTLYYYGQADYARLLPMAAVVAVFMAFSSLTLGRRYHDSI